MLIFVPSGDSSGISVTGETPQERGFRGEEAHRTPHGKRPLGTKISADQNFLISPTSYIVQPQKSTSHPAGAFFVVKKEGIVPLF